ncbi:MAG: glycosyltransferase, partial [Firmicutes bacterium]|nr:glycosyltransferase [Bacillota bacterium]
WTDNYPNVEMKGLVPQRELPGYIKDFDVCLNVFADNDLSRDVSPLKFYEYLATGKPVVSTLVPLQVLDYVDCIYLAETPDEFVTRCREALEEGPDSPKRTERIEAARRNSWDEKVAEMKEILAW